MGASAPFVAALAASIITSILAFGAAWRLADRQRIEERALRSIESEKTAISEVQHAAAQLADATSVAAMVGPLFKGKSPEVITSQPWFHQWQSSRRQLEISALRVADQSLRAQALEVRAMAMDPTGFKIATSESDREALKAHRETVDDAVNRLNELAGRIYMGLYANNQLSRQRWNCIRTSAVTSSGGEQSRERWLCNRR